MATDPKKVMKSLVAEVSSDFNLVMDQFYKELKRLTPVKTGRAQRNWRRRKDTRLNTTSTTQAIVNEVPYIQPLDEGHSRQAPNGIVTPAWENVKQRRSRK